MAQGVKAKILVVDDLPEKILVYRAMLEELGQEIVAAQSGEEALKQVLNHEFAVILLDVNMPGFDGFETAALIRKRKRSAHTPIIFVTAFADELRTSEGYAHGAVDFILAPVVPDVLRAKIRVFVELYRMAEELRRRTEEQIALAEERSRREAVEEANRRLSFLVHAKGIVGQSLDEQATTRDILRLVVPRLADRALIALYDEDGRRRGTEGHIEGGDIIVQAVPPWEELPAAWRDAVGGVCQQVGGAGADSSQSPLDEPQTLVLPLRGRQRIFGALVLSHDSPERTWSGPDLTMVEALALRCGIALENARLYRELQHADRQKNEFLSMLAHELRNPLAPIRSAVDVLRLLEGDQPDVSWARDIIDRQLTHLVRLVDDLLDVSRITRGKIRLEPAQVSVAEIVATAVETSRPLIEAGSHRLSVSLPEQPAVLHGDRTRLAQVLSNLLNNAAKYTPPGGSISLDVRLEPRPRPLAQYSEDATDVVIRVRDTGMGIPPEMLSKVFDLFTQVDRSLDRSQGGLGIGLTLVRKLVEMHGGSVRVASEGPGKGSEFTVRLPLEGAREDVDAEAEPSEEPELNGRRLRILIVDDNHDAADALARLFRVSGHEPRVVYDGLASAAAVREFGPDAVILDLGLPGVDGLTIARELRADPETRGIALVAVSGYGQEEFVRKSGEAGFDHHFCKPVDAAALLKELSRLTQRPQAAAIAVP